MSTIKVKVKWQAVDGYVGRRPHETKIDASDFIGLDRDEAERVFDEILDDAFRQKVRLECDDYDASLQEIMDAAAKLEEAE